MVGTAGKVPLQGPVSPNLEPRTRIRRIRLRPQMMIGQAGRDSKAAVNAPDTVGVIAAKASMRMATQRRGEPEAQ